MKTKKGNRIIILGTSSALCDEKRDNTYLALVIYNRIILIDCAGSPVHKLAKAGLDFKRIDSIIITHLHIDHIYGLPSLLHSFLMIKRERALTIFCPNGTKNSLKEFILFHKDLIKIGFKINIFEVSTYWGVFYKHRDLRIYSLPSNHNTPSISLAINKNNKWLFYSGDTSPNEELIRRAKGCEVLIHECTFRKRKTIDHTSLYDLEDILKRICPKKTILIHLNPFEDYRNYKKIYGEKYDVILGKDFTEISL